MGRLDTAFSIRDSWLSWTRVLAWLSYLVGGGLACPNAHAQSTPPGAPDEARARIVIERGEKLFEAQNYDAALSEFLAGYALLKGDARQYIVLNNIAVCHERAFRYDLALEFYARYLLEGGRDARDRVEVEAAIQTLRELLVTIDIESNVVAAVWVDNRRLGRAPGKVLVPAGKHVVELHAPLYESKRRELLVTAGSQPHLSFELQHLSQFEGLSPAYFWVGTALTVAAIGTGTVLGISAISADAAGRQRASQNHFLNTVEHERAVQNKATAADLAFASAALLGASTIVLFFLTDFRGEDRAGSSTAATVRVDLRGLRLAGNF